RAAALVERVRRRQPGRQPGRGGDLGGPGTLSGRVDRGDLVVVRRAVRQAGVGERGAAHAGLQRRRPLAAGGRAAVEAVAGRPGGGGPRQRDLGVAGRGGHGGRGRRRRLGRGGRFGAPGTLTSAVDGRHLVVVRRPVCQPSVRERGA